MSAPISAFVGRNGSGKTLCAVERLAMTAAASRRVVMANFEIDVPRFEYLHSWRQLTDVRDSVIILDEITACLPARQALSMPAELARVLQQLRKRNCVVGWTAPAWSNADKLLRQVTATVTVCRGLLDERKRSTMWPEHRLFYWRTYAAEDFETFTFSQGGARPRIRALRKEWYWRKRHEAHNRYSTLNEVGLLDHLDEASGTCLTCGGRRVRPKCSCSGPPAKRASAEDGPWIVPSLDALALHDEHEHTINEEGTHDVFDGS